MSGVQITPPRPIKSMGYGMRRNPFFVEKWLGDKTGYKNGKAEKTAPCSHHRNIKNGRLSEYAERLGKTEGAIRQHRSAAEVIKNLVVDYEVLLDKAAHLAALVASCHCAMTIFPGLPIAERFELLRRHNNLLILARMASGSYPRQSET